MLKHYLVTFIVVLTVINARKARAVDSIYFGVTNMTSYLDDTFKIEKRVDVQLICSVTTDRSYSMRILNDQTEALISKYSTFRPSLILLLRNFSCDDTGRYTCVVENELTKHMSKFLYLSTKCPPRLCYRGLEAPRIMANLGSSVTLSTCVLFDWLFGGYYSIHVNGRLINDQHDAQYKVELTYLSPVHLNISVTVRDVSASHYGVNALGFKEGLNGSTVFIFNFTISRPDLEPTLDPAIISIITVLAITSVLLIMCLIYKHKRGENSGRYRVSPRLSSSCDSNGENHYEQLNHANDTRYQSGDSVQADASKYYSLSHEAGCQRLLDDGHVDPDDPHTAEYITPTNDYDDNCMIAKPPTPCSTPFGSSEPKELSSQRKFSNKRSVQSGDVFEELRSRELRKELERDEDSTVSGANHLESVKIYTHSNELQEPKFIRNPIYDNECVRNPNTFTSVVAADVSVVDEITDIKRNIDRSIQELEDFERTLTRTKLKHAKRLSSVPEAGNLAKDSAVGGVVTFKMTKTSQDSDALSPTKSIRQYFQGRINDDGFKAMLELADYVKN